MNQDEVCQVEGRVKERLPVLARCVRSKGPSRKPCENCTKKSKYVIVLDMRIPFIKFLNFKNLSAALNSPPNKCFQDSIAIPGVGGSSSGETRGTWQEPVGYPETRVLLSQVAKT